MRSSFAVHSRYVSTGGAVSLLVCRLELRFRNKDRERHARAAPVADRAYLSLLCCSLLAFFLAFLRFVGQRVVLTALERVIWPSRVWRDGIKTRAMLLPVCA